MPSAVLYGNDIFPDDEARDRLTETMSNLPLYWVVVTPDDELPREIRELMETAPLDVPFESYSQGTQESVIRGLKESQTVKLGSFSGYVK